MIAPIRSNAPCDRIPDSSAEINHGGTRDLILIALPSSVRGPLTLRRCLSLLCVSRDAARGCTA